VLSVPNQHTPASRTLVFAITCRVFYISGLVVSRDISDVTTTQTDSIKSLPIPDTVMGHVDWEADPEASDLDGSEEQDRECWDADASIDLGAAAAGPSSEERKIAEAVHYSERNL
jgi:hypothetical protein